MKAVFCTLFDSNYLDRGLVMYRSLERVTNDYTLYILPMNEKCRDVLLQEALEHVVVVNFDNFIEYEKLEVIFRERIAKEFCWTCSSHVIDYVLRYYGEESCTYIDADMYFYANPTELIERIGNKSAQIIEHGFPNNAMGRKNLHASGRFCVEFNTFINNDRGLGLLTWWKNKCRELCTSVPIDGVFGDQKYLEEWIGNADVNILNEPGAGIAPWNVELYRNISFIQGEAFVTRKGVKKPQKVFFYHFHALKEVSNNVFDIAVFDRSIKHDDKTILWFYKKYLELICHERNALKKKYGIEFSMCAASESKVYGSRIRHWMKCFKNEGEGLKMKDRIAVYCLIVKSHFEKRKNILRVNM